MNGAQINILLVDDDTADIELARQTLKSAGTRFALDVATSIRTARQAIAAHAPDLLLAAGMLPDGKGLELLPDSRTKARFPIVLMTRPGNEELAVEAMEAGALDYLTKTPEMLADLAHIAERALREWAYITSREKAEEERHRLETQVLQTQKLESLGVLAGGIAHDFNNVLMVILGNATLALDEVPTASTAHNALTEIESAAKRAADLCNQMLAYSGRGKFLIQPISLNDTIREFARLLEMSISKSAVLELDLMAGLPAIEADPTQVRQIVMNLVTNGSEALGGRSGIIAISTGVMECDRDYLRNTYLDEGLPEGIYVYVEIGDTGSGMAPETLQKVFDPFFSTKFTGRGLGLAAVLGIVRSHGGAIRVTSDPGKGTTFRVLFPAIRQRRDDGAVPADAPRREWQGGGYILLVDDEESVRTVGKLILEKMKFSVLTAADGRQALDIFRERQDELNCVLLDLTMPHMGGEEAFREMHRLNSKIPIILTSGYTEEGIGDRFHAQGLAGFIQKPYEAARLIDTLMTILGR